MKRLLVAAVVLSAIGVVGVSNAAEKCSRKYIAAGDHGEAVVTFTDAEGRTVKIHTKAFGNFLLGPASTGNLNGNHLCPPGIRPTSGVLRVFVDGVRVCANFNKPPAFDPFIFGGGIHNSVADPCGADVTWDGLSWFIAPAPPSGPPDPLPMGSRGGRSTSVWAGDAQPAIVDGIYWYGGTTYTVPTGTVGWFSNHGAQVVVKGFLS